MRKIPILFNNDRQIATIDECAPVISRVYDKWWKIFGITKIYHVRGVKVVIENKKQVAYELR